MGIATAKSKSSAGQPPVVNVYRALDGGIHHTRCSQRMTYRGRASGSELEFHCGTCHERVVMPQIIVARLPLVTSGAA